MSAQQAKVLAGGQTSHIWGSWWRASGAWGKLSPWVSQLLRLLLNPTTGDQLNFPERGGAQRPPETLLIGLWTGAACLNGIFYSST